MVTAHKEVGEPRQDGGQQQEEGSMDTLDIQAEATDRAEAEDMRAASQEVAPAFGPSRCKAKIRQGSGRRGSRRSGRPGR